MRGSEALVIALGMITCPHVTRRARHSPLPKGVTFLLEVAAEETDALREASVLTGQTEAHLRKAAGFFVEQMLLCQPVDHYRILGCSCDSTNADLRRHMALIMRWLHPDVISSGASAYRFDKGLYAARVTEAWEALKTNERRAAYDTALAARMKWGGTRPAGVGRHLLVAPPLERTAIAETRLQIRLRPPPFKRGGIWKRVLLLFAGQP